MAKTKVKASEIVDWRYRDYVFYPVDGGLKGRIVAWGKVPADGTVLSLVKDGTMHAYRVTGYKPHPPAADYDGYTILVEFVPGSTIEEDR